MTHPDLSILIPGIPERVAQATSLYEDLLRQQQPFDGMVEIIYLLDNRRRTVGAKRNSLLDAANGNYLAFVDDDDYVSPWYIRRIMEVLGERRPDVITFKQKATILPEGFVHHCTYDLRHVRRNPRRLLVARDTAGEPTKEADWSGPPAHTMVWKAAIVKPIRFPEANFGEDAHWCDVASLAATTQVDIPETLYYYTFDAAKSRTRGR